MSDAPPGESPIDSIVTQLLEDQDHLENENGSTKTQSVNQNQGELPHGYI